MTTLNINLPEALKDFVVNQATKAGYPSSSEYVEALLREAQRRTAKQELERMLLQGIESGSAGEMTQRDWQELRQELQRRIDKRRKKNGKSGKNTRSTARSA